jgi:hypothetical protein
MPSKEVTTWWFRLSGGDMDLGNAVRLFKADELRVERRNGPDSEDHAYLCSTRFDGIEDTQNGQLMLSDLSTRLLSLMNGALRLHCGSWPLKIEGQVAEKADGTFGLVIKVASAYVRLPMSAAATPDGGGPSTPEQWVLADDPEGDIQDALIHFSRGGNNWFDLWKAFEVVQADVRRNHSISEKSLLADLVWSIFEAVQSTLRRHRGQSGTSPTAKISRFSGRSLSDIRDFCTVANYHRHEERNDPKRAKKAKKVMIDLKKGNKIMAAILRGLNRPGFAGGCLV